MSSLGCGSVDIYGKEYVSTKELTYVLAFKLITHELVEIFYFGL